MKNDLEGLKKMHADALLLLGPDGVGSPHSHVQPLVSHGSVVLFLLVCLAVFLVHKLVRLELEAAKEELKRTVLQHTVRVV